MERIKKRWENEELMMIGRREADGSSEEKSGSQEDCSLQEECGSITVSLKDKTERLLFQEKLNCKKAEDETLQGEFVKELDSICPWSAEDPYLYKLEIALEKKGKIAGKSGY